MGEKKEKFIIFTLAGILLLIICLPVKKEEDISSGEAAATRRETAPVAGQETAAETDSDKDGYAAEMEKELEELLGCMEGVGKVKVMITLQSTEEDIVEKDRPLSRSSAAENDSVGGSRNTSGLDSEETTVFMTDADGRQIPYVRKKIRPVVGGVAVMAEGGGNETVRANISEAIQALFGIDANKIKIAKMKTAK